MSAVEKRSRASRNSLEFAKRCTNRISLRCVCSVKNTKYKNKPSKMRIFIYVYEMFRNNFKGKITLFVLYIFIQKKRIRSEIFHIFFILDPKISFQDNVTLNNYILFQEARIHPTILVLRTLSRKLIFRDVKRYKARLRLKKKISTKIKTNGIKRKDYSTSRQRKR